MIMGIQRKKGSSRQAVTRQPAPGAIHPASDAARHAMIAAAAYLFAEQRGFHGDAALMRRYASETYVR